MPIYQTKNWGRATLAGGITAGATSFSVASGQGAALPAAPFLAVIYDTLYSRPGDDPGREIVAVGARSGDALSSVARGQDGTTGVAHNTAGRTYRIEQVLTSGQWEAELAALMPRSGARHRCVAPGNQLERLNTAGVWVPDIPAGSTGFIAGLAPEFNSAGTGGPDSISFAAGAAEIQSLGRVLSAGVTTVTVPTGTSVWHHVYVYPATDTTLAYEVSTVAPSLTGGTTLGGKFKTGDTSRRWVWSFRRQADGLLLGTTFNDRASWVVLRDTDAGTASLLVSNGTASSYTEVLITSHCPMHPKCAVLDVWNKSTNRTASIWLFPGYNLRTVAPGVRTQIELYVNNSGGGLFGYSIASGADAGVDIRLVSYGLER